MKEIEAFGKDIIKSLYALFLGGEISMAFWKGVGGWKPAHRAGLRFSPGAGIGLRHLTGRF